MKVRDCPGGGYDPAMRWLFIATLPSGGSTALAQLLLTAPKTVSAAHRAEAQWLVPSMCAPENRWNSEAAIDLAAVREIWMAAARAKASQGALVIEKSPPNLCRMRALLRAFDGCSTSLLRFHRHPLAVCASWARLYSPNVVINEWEPGLAGKIDSGEDFLAALGDICGRRFAMLEDLADIADLTVGYEELASTPADVIDRLAGLDPILGKVDPAMQLLAGTRYAQVFRNLNGEQLCELTPGQLQAICKGLAPHASTFAAFGYDFQSLG